MPSQPITLTTYLALWGSIVSTILGIIKYYEFRRDRLYLVVRTEFDLENRIKIINPSKVAVQILDFELFWATKRLFLLLNQKPIRIDEEEGHLRSNLLAPNSFTYLQLQDATVIPWRQRPEGTSLYLKIMLAGKHNRQILLIC